MRAAYVNPVVAGIPWGDPTPVRVGPLLGEPIGYLDQGQLDARRRAHAESVLIDLLEPVDVSTIELRMPSDARAREVAMAIDADPADPKTLAAWGEVVGASSRTLARTFMADTGITFGRWRTLARLQAGLDRSNAWSVLQCGRSPGPISSGRGVRRPPARMPASRRSKFPSIPSSSPPRGG
jgi:AraC-like DNA-binding protein